MTGENVCKLASREHQQANDAYGLYNRCISGSQTDHQAQIKAHRANWLI